MILRLGKSIMNFWDMNMLVNFIFGRGDMECDYICINCIVVY